MNAFAERMNVFVVPVNVFAERVARVPATHERDFGTCACVGPALSCAPGARRLQRAGGGVSREAAPARCRAR